MNETGNAPGAAKSSSASLADGFYLRPNQDKTCQHAEQTLADIEGACCELNNLDNATGSRQCEKKTAASGLQGPGSSEASDSSNWSARFAGVGIEVGNCKPTASLRAKRRWVTLIATAVTAGLLAASLLVPGGRELLAPGPLCSQHARLMDVDGVDRCSACHAAADTAPANWFLSIFQGNKSWGPTQSELCLQCHGDQLSHGRHCAARCSQQPGTSGGDALLSSMVDSEAIQNSGHALSPHGLAPEYLQKSTDQQTGASGIARRWKQAAGLGAKNDVMACARCHHEHRGSDNVLTAMSDAQCQSCHQQQFASFELAPDDGGHPEFAAYPQRRRSRIAFDHAAHMKNYFPQRQAAFDCRRCHVDDAFQDVQRLASYEQACADCHGAAVQTSVQAGFDLISLPMLDTDALTEAGVDVGYWPEPCVGDFDGQIPALGRILLLGDPAARQALEKLGDDFEFFDVDTDRQDQLQAVGQLAWSIKRLIHDLAEDSEYTVRARLQAVARDGQMTESIQQLAAMFDDSSARRAAAAWYPTLSQEIGNRPTTQAEIIGQQFEFGKPGSVFRSASSQRILSLQDQPPEDPDLLVANPLAGLMDDQMSRIPPKRPGQGSQIQEDNQNQKPAEQVPASHSPASQSPASQSPANQSPLRDSMQNPYVPKPAAPIDDQDLLVDNPLTGLMSELRQRPGAGAVSQVVPLQPEPLVENPSTGTPVQLPQGNQSAASGGEYDLESILRMAGRLQQSQQNRVGIWVEDHASYTIRYLPAGHADQLLRATLDVLAHEGDNPLTAGVLDAQRTSISTGACATCHTLEQSSPGSEKLLFNWRARYRDPSIADFTWFSHRPHLLQPETSDCQSCHQLDLSRDLSQQYVGLDPFTSCEDGGYGNFTPITKAHCAACHRESAASNSCTTCHNYHVGALRSSPGN